MVVSSVTPWIPAAILVKRSGRPRASAVSVSRMIRSSSESAGRGIGDRAGAPRTRRPCGRAGWRRRRRRGSCSGRPRPARSAPARCTTSTPPASRPSRRRPGRPAAAIAAAAWSWVEKMLQEAQRTSAPSATRVSIRTAVWTVMWSEPVIRAPASGCAAAYSSRVRISPGISCSARVISLRPNSASPRSATLKSCVTVVRHAAPDRDLAPDRRQACEPNSLTPMRAMVMAAGLGTRLRPLTHEIPKPLVPVANRPIMEHILELLARQG